MKILAKPSELRPVRAGPARDRSSCDVRRLWTKPRVATEAGAIERSDAGGGYGPRGRGAAGHGGVRCGKPGGPDPRLGRLGRAVRRGHARADPLRTLGFVELSLSPTLATTATGRLAASLQFGEINTVTALGPFLGSPMASDSQAVSTRRVPTRPMTLDGGLRPDFGSPPGRGVEQASRR